MGKYCYTSRRGEWFTDCSVRQLVNQSLSQIGSQSVGQPVRQTDRQPFSQSVSQSVRQSIGQTDSRSTVSRLVSQRNRLSFSQLVRRVSQTNRQTFSRVPNRSPLSLYGNNQPVIFYLYQPTNFKLVCHFNVVSH